MEKNTKSKDQFGMRLLKGLRGLAYVILVVMCISVLYSGSLKIQAGNSQNSTVTCSNSQSFTFISIGINASNYNPYTTQLYPSDNAIINSACGANSGATYSLRYDTRSSDPNSMGTAIQVLGIGAIIIEIIYRFLAYISGVKV